ncbi:MAG: nucleoside monophosphate kinase [Candidatus Roizmanbacteria bacterium]|nr:MAG: nucleoside monophosphate kinase [Candidatus Roizmanbacteria bacterium]
MKLVLIGIQGSGKSTQGNLLSKQLHIPYLSTGHIFREIAKEKTELGKYLKLTMSAGMLIPDQKTIEIVNNYISRPEYKRGYIIDGFPRTVRQAEEFKNNVDKVIYLDIPEKEALWRIAYRNDQTRTDETLPALRKRIELFNRHTVPVLDYYEKEGKLAVIDGTQSIKDVNKAILKSLGKQLIKNQIKEWEQKNKAMIAIAGLPGAGKTEAANFFKKKGLPIISFGKIINDCIDQQNLTHTEEVHKKIRMGLREQHGEEALAILSEKEIKETLEKNTIVVIDGLRSWKEYLYLKNKFPEVDIYILTLFADKDIRYKRISKRRSRFKLYGEQRDINELIGTNMGPTIAFADFLIKNNFSKEDLEDKLEHVYRSVYFK